MRKMKGVVSIIAAAAVATSLLADCGGSGGSSTTAAETKAAEITAVTAETAAAETAADTTVVPATVENPMVGKKVAYIVLLPSATIFQMWKDSCAPLCDALDARSDFPFCGGDFNKWQDTIRICTSAGYNGLLVSHDNRDGSYVFLREITEQHPDMKIVTSDTQSCSGGEYQKPSDTTQMFQQDKPLVTAFLDQTIEKYGESVRLIKVWRGPDYDSPFDRREVGWREHEAAGKIITVGEIQPLQDSVDSVNTVTTVYLQGMNRADVGGVIAYYDLCGQSVHNAIAENDNFNGKNGDAFPVASVDIDPIDVINMQTRPNIWTTTETTDWAMNSGTGMCILMLGLADQYDKISDPATGGSGMGVVEVPGTVIKAGTLKLDSIVENLGSIAGETHGSLDYLSVVDWMPRDSIHK